MLISAHTKAFATTLLLYLILGGFCKGQTHRYSDKVRKNVAAVAAQIAADSTVDGELVGRAPITTEQYLRYKKLVSLANESELRSLTNHSSAIVRCYAVKGFFDRGSTEVLGILRAHEFDTAIVVVRNGCMIGMPRVVDYMWSKFYNQQKSGTYKLTPADTLLLKKLRASRWARHEQNEAKLKKEYEAIQPQH